MQIIALETVGNRAIHRRMRNNFGPSKEAGRHKSSEKDTKEK